MGRHSAPDDEVTGAAVAVGERSSAPARHAQHDEVSDEPAASLLTEPADTTSAEPAETAVETDPTGQREHDLSVIPWTHHDEPAEQLDTAEPVPASALADLAAGPVTAEPYGASSPGSGAAGESSPRRSGTRADLQLLRSDPGLRARCIAAVFGPVVIYTVVMVVIGRSDIYLLWLWIPVVLAGVLFGACLDSASRRRTKPPQPDTGDPHPAEPPATEPPTTEAPADPFAAAEPVTEAADPEPTAVEAPTAEAPTAEADQQAANPPL